MNKVDITQLLPSYLIPFVSDANISLFLQIFTGLLAVALSVTLLLKLIRLRVNLNIVYVLLEVKPVYKTLQSPLSTQQLFTVLHSLERHTSFIQSLLGIKRTASFELISDKEKGIRYILRVPESNVTLIKKTLISYLPGVEVKEISDYLPNDYKQLNNNKYFIVRELKLSRPFPIPLQSQDKLDQHDPIAYLAGYMTKLNVGELAGLQIVNTPVLQRTHKPIRNHISRLKELLMSGKDVKKELYKGKLHKLYSALEFMIQGEKKETVSQSRKELYEAVESKINEPLYESTIRLFALSDSRSSGVTRMKGLQSSFETFASQHQSFTVKHVLLTKVKNNFLDKLRFYFIKNRLLSLTANPVLSASEISSLYHLPYTATTKTEDLIKVRSPKLPSPLPLKSSHNNLDMIFAHNTYGETTVPIGLTLEERRRHVYIIGATGTGKTTALLHMIHNDLLKGSGVAIIDPHGDLTQRLLGVISQERIQDVVYLNPYDIKHPIGLNILEIPEGLSEAGLQREKDMIASSMVSIFQKLYPARYSGPRMEHILRNAVLTALELEKPTLLTVYKLLTDLKFRNKVVRKLSNSVLKDFWKNEFGKLGRFQKAEQISPITNKLGRFLTTSMTRNILSQEKSKLDFEDILNNKKILLCDLSKGKIGEDTSSFLGSLLVTKIQLAAFRRVHTQQDKRTDFFVYIDEFQNFATPSFAQILSEARKYRLNAILAHQTMSQIEDKDLLRVILANVGSVISFRTSNPTDEEMILPMFAPVVEKHEIANLPLYNFYMKINAVEPQDAFTGSVDDFTVEDSESVRKAVIRQSRAVYGTEVQVENGGNIQVSKINEKDSSKTQHVEVRGMIK